MCGWYRCALVWVHRCECAHVPALAHAGAFTCIYIFLSCLYVLSYHIHVLLQHMCILCVFNYVIGPLSFTHTRSLSCEMISGARYKVIERGFLISVCFLAKAQGYSCLIMSFLLLSLGHSSFFPTPPLCFGPGVAHFQA